jgi:uncharacterized protein YxeA
MKKIIIITVMLLFVVVGYNYVYREPRNITEETPEFLISSSLLKKELKSNQDLVLKKYIDKTIQVSGSITLVDDQTIVLDHFISVQITAQKEVLSSGTTVVVKGRFIGYDELLEEIKLDQCTLISKQ